jgi:hypothetical protein
VKSNGHFEIFGKQTKAAIYSGFNGCLDFSTLLAQARYPDDIEKQLKDQATERDWSLLKTMDTNVRIPTFLAKMEVEAFTMLTTKTSEAFISF